MLRSATLRFAALVFLLQILAAAALLLGLGAMIRQQSRAEALDVAETLRDDLVATQAQGGMAALRQAIDLRLSRQATRGIVVALADRSGRIVAGNLAALPPEKPVQRGPRTVDVLRNGHAESEAALVLSVPFTGGQALLVGTVVESDQQFVALFERASLIVLAMSLVLAAFAAVLATRQIVLRLQATITTLGGVGAGDLGRRVPSDKSGDAFARLGIEVNRALDRVAALNTELKIATDVLAHDLKSPLTRMMSALDRAAARVDDPSARAAVDLAQSEGARVMAMIDTALGISRAEAGIGRDSFVPVDLAVMIETIAEIYAPLVEDEARALVVSAPASLVLPIHRHFMDQAIGNLLDNTIKYGAGTIALAVEQAGDVVLISVTDEGPGIPADLREKALSRFGRLDEARGGWGAGLGLALVQAVAHLHDGSVNLDDGPDGRGLKVTLRLPCHIASSTSTLVRVTAASKR
ncbi:MAG: hypothetical protein RIS85_2650 [Pseudomonadota bacterium]